jgi:hypothetical protein
MSPTEIVPVRLTEAERLQLLEDAHRREHAGGSWRVQHVMAVLDMSRATVYRTPWLRRIKKRRGARGVSWIPKDVRAASERASTAPPSRSHRRAVS